MITNGSESLGMNVLVGMPFMNTFIGNSVGSLRLDVILGPTAGGHLLEQVIMIVV